MNSDVSFLGAPVGCIQNTQDFLTGKDFSAFKMRIKCVKLKVTRSLRGFSMRTFINKGNCNTTTRRYSDLVDNDGVKCFAEQGGGQTRGGLDRM